MESQRFCAFFSLSACPGLSAGWWSDRIRFQWPAQSSSKPGTYHPSRPPTGQNIGLYASLEHAARFLQLVSGNFGRPFSGRPPDRVLRQHGPRHPHAASRGVRCIQEAGNRSETRGPEGRSVQGSLSMRAPTAMKNSKTSIADTWIETACA
ncbi:hypothetical protein AURDEDRAFT_117940 [Auricularia subglabra TFB-10046 SS5]|uniref:Uncharacterized protein n=1 Tax=Auricularia subglabra (strain TFB-10046 / SS5) TaxID=717982 RepID=J0D340_AURST|nr:hypothetical protein AURDEDRAFT_117940 [Auricularia subglabra TFB-10046 SS5]